MVTRLFVWVAPISCTGLRPRRIDVGNGVGWSLFGMPTCQVSRVPPTSHQSTRGRYEYPHCFVSRIQIFPRSRGHISHLTVVPAQTFGLIFRNLCATRLELPFCNVNKAALRFSTANASSLTPKREVNNHFPRPPPAVPRRGAFIWTRQVDRSCRAHVRTQGRQQACSMYGDLLPTARPELNLSAQSSSRSMTALIAVAVIFVAAIPRSDVRRRAPSFTQLFQYARYLWRRDQKSMNPRSLHLI